MADYRRHFEDGPRHERDWPERARDEVRSWYGDDKARPRRGNDERDDRAAYEDRNYAGHNYGAATGAYRTDDRGYHDRYRVDRYRDDDLMAGGRDYPNGAPNGQPRRGLNEAAEEYYRAAREQRGDFERWEAQSPGANWDDNGGRDSARPWTRREVGGYWRQYENRPHFSGRGPKDYRRSDERVREEICDAMTDDWMLDASEITVAVAEGEVTLSGTVNSRNQKRRAEDVAERVSGVKDVTNQLRVIRDSNGHSTTAAQPVTQTFGHGTPSKSTSGTSA